MIHVVIVGSGPAGLAAASRLIQRREIKVTVIERSTNVGGLAGSFELAGLRVDYGSHRLHPACDPRILRDIRQMLGNDLLTRPRHGRIHLMGRWIHFPLTPTGLLGSLPPIFAFGVALDFARRAWPQSFQRTKPATFASVLQQGLGATICRTFYFPYAKKIWGLEPQELSAVQAHRRVRATSPGKLLKKVLAATPGVKPKNSGCFYYPRQGYGQISEAYYLAACRGGANFLFQADVEAIDVSTRDRYRVEFRKDGLPQALDADHVWSTIPITHLARRIRPNPPSDVLESTKHIRYRSMILIYLVIGQKRFSEFDAHYFPELEIPITRMSEPRNYSALSEPSDRSVLCAELPCTKGDNYWSLTDEELGKLVQDALVRLRVPIQGPVLNVVTRRLPHAYPIYDQGFEPYFQRLDTWINGLPNVLTFGRQGLFAHDNTHHALAMAYAAVECLAATGEFDEPKWALFRKTFESHIVED